MEVENGVTTASPFDVTALLVLHKDFKNAVTMATSQNVNDHQKTSRIIIRKMIKAKFMRLNHSKQSNGIREKPNGEGVRVGGALPPLVKIYS